MALQAETLVEEWLNKNGYFTIRGIKEKLNEIDFLAVRQSEDGEWEYVHCEVLVSMRPVAYISKLTKQQMEKLGVKSKTSAKLRNSESLKDSVKAWVEIKYTSDKKKKLRSSVIDTEEWQYWLVHGRVKDQNELEQISGEGVKLVAIKDILQELTANTTEHSFSAASAGDLVELINLLNTEE
ncbi:hypothetical protein A8L34_23380 [Bacillus sp. FJAT-27264]|uniref:hypothetical protein n=1 Tax=Paenibacillus sp. (strain DSM 101736 / FJAT-27264) TaxID=1850362 RepID=UPI000807FD28|nr:hypothetical protein [Bacillus sp. FJAT-27264]OBZ09088.1 hypothetical protein A8L34_23380 [Bacillus sp. FJAT-27264]